MEGGEGCIPIDSDHLFHQDPHRPEPHHRVGQRRDPAAHLAEHLVVAERRIAPPLQVERILAKLLCAQLGLGRGVDLHHLDAVRADQRADAAAGAVVQRVVGRGRAGVAEPLRLRADVLRPRKQVGDGHDRARAGADVALDAQVGGAFDVFEECGGVGFAHRGSIASKGVFRSAYSVVCSCRSITHDGLRNTQHGHTLTAR